MTGMDGISSLQKMLGALQGNDATSVKGSAQPTAAKAASASAAGAAASPTVAGKGVDSASLSLAGGLAAGSTDLTDVRMTKVAELKQAIGSGSYNVPSSAVADKIVESLLK